MLGRVGGLSAGWQPVPQAQRYHGFLRARRVNQVWLVSLITSIQIKELGLCWSLTFFRLLGWRGLRGRVS